MNAHAKIRMMPYDLNEAELEAVSMLPAPQRYAHFLKRIADWEEVWLLKTDNGYASFGDDSGNNGIGFWPHPAYAEQHISNDAPGKSVPISLVEFKDKWLKGMQRDGVKAVVFPTPTLQGLMLEPTRVQSDLSDALSEYE